MVKDEETYFGYGGGFAVHVQYGLHGEGAQQ
jgi:hypothetical protein